MQIYFVDQNSSDREGREGNIASNTTILTSMPLAPCQNLKHWVWMGMNESRSACQHGRKAVHDWAASRWPLKKRTSQRAPGCWDGSGGHRVRVDLDRFKGIYKQQELQGTRIATCKGKIKRSKANEKQCPFFVIVCGVHFVINIYLNSHLVTPTCNTTFHPIFYFIALHSTAPIYS